MRPALVSEADFLSLPETVDKVELIDGEVVVSPSPSVRHQLLLGEVYVALRAWASTAPTRASVFQCPLDVRFGEDRVLQPDALVILDTVAPDAAMPLERIPELCVEVLSGDRVYDRVTKRLIYAAAGVRELWIVEPSRVVERWTGEGLAAADEVTGLLSTPLLPGFELDVAAMFARVLGGEA